MKLPSRVTTFLGTEQQILRSGRRVFRMSAIRAMPMQLFSAYFQLPWHMLCWTIRLQLSFEGIRPIQTFSKRLRAWTRQIPRKRANRNAICGRNREMIEKWKKEQEKEKENRQKGSSTNAFTIITHIGKIAIINTLSTWSLISMFDLYPNMFLHTFKSIMIKFTLNILWWPIIFSMTQDLSNVRYNSLISAQCKARCLYEYRNYHYQRRSPRSMFNFRSTQPLLVSSKSLFSSLSLFVSSLAARWLSGLRPCWNTWRSLVRNPWSQNFPNGRVYGGIVSQNSAVKENQWDL